MNPSYHSLFVHLETRKPLTFFGSTEDNRWHNGLLWVNGKQEMYPVIDGIPVFVAPTNETDPSEDLRRLHNGTHPWGPDQAWKSIQESLTTDDPMFSEFARHVAESRGLILDVASGPGGGLAPAVLHFNPEAPILMTDLRLGLLQDWQRVLRDKALHTSFAVTDARSMPLRSDSMDVIEDMGGLDNVEEPKKAVEEAYRILKPGGTLFSINSVFVKEDLLKLPRGIRTKLQTIAPALEDGLLGVLRHAGFRVFSHVLLGQRELPMQNGYASREAAKYQVTLHMKQYRTEAKKKSQ